MSPYERKGEIEQNRLKVLNEVIAGHMTGQQAAVQAVTVLCDIRLDRALFAIRGHDRSKRAQFVNFIFRMECGLWRLVHLLERLGFSIGDIVFIISGGAVSGRSNSFCTIASPHRMGSVSPGQPRRPHPTPSARIGQIIFEVYLSYNSAA